MRWLQGLACGMVVIMATPTAVLVGLLLLPTLMTFVADRQPGRPAARAVLLFGLAASCPALDMLWRAGHRLSDALALASDIRSLALAWAAQAAGWLLTQILPVLLGIAVEAQTQLTMSRLRKRRDALQAEWGPERS